MEHEPRIAPMPEEEQPSSEGFLRRFKLPLIIVGGIVVLAGAAIGAALLFGGRGTPAPVHGNGNLPLGGQSVGNGNLPPEMGAPTSSFGGTPLPGQMVVDWYQWPVPDYVWSVEDSGKLQQLSADPSFQDPISDSWRVYRVGKVTQGPYTGGTVYLAQPPEEGPGTPPIYQVISVPEESGVRLKELVAIVNSGENIWPPQLAQVWTINDRATFANLEPPETIAIPGSTMLLRRGADRPSLSGAYSKTMLLQLENPERVFEYAPGRYVYRSPYGGCLLVAAADGTLRPYYFDWAFIGGEPKSLPYNGETAYGLRLTFTGGQPQVLEYVVRSVGRCGAGGCYSYADYITSDSQLQEVAKTSDGQPLYGLRDTEVKGYPQARMPLLREMYDSYYPGPNTEKVSYEAFLADHPVLFWRDPYGRYIQFTKSSYTPAAECGKPVIYLYPEREMDVAVRLELAGGFSVTEPKYPDGGWKVRAKPSGELRSYADGKTYPYLFWEGFGESYPRPTDGFVVARADVESFLRKTLPKLGLLKHEYDEFIDFWLPKMQADPYYRISFVPQAEFNKVAPMYVTPRPDTVIRVFMDYEGLSAPIALRQPVIRTPERKGFTVVEWGGALH